MGEVAPVVNAVDNIIYKNEPTRSKEEIRQAIGELTKLMLAEEQVELPVIHHHADGVYGREMRMKKGEVCVGKIHVDANLNVLVSGEVSVFSIEGELRIKAPYIYVAVPGVQRTIVCQSDTAIWLVTHATEETDLQKIEEQVIAKDYVELEQKQKLQIKE